MFDLLQKMLYSDAGSTLNNWAVRGFRVLLAAELFRVHGLPKFRPLPGVPVEEVPNALGLSTSLNQFIATCSDTVVPALVILGVATRLAVLPTLGVTAAGYFVGTAKARPRGATCPTCTRYVFCWCYYSGPGRFSSITISGPG